MLWLLMTLALLAALAVSGGRAWRRQIRRRALAELPGGSRDTALEIEAFSEIETHLLRRECPCGGLLASLGERSERRGSTLLRIVRVECRRCEERFEIWFDATRAYH